MALHQQSKIWLAFLSGAIRGINGSCYTVIQALLDDIRFLISLEDFNPWGSVEEARHSIMVVRISFVPNMVNCQ